MALADSGSVKTKWFSGGHLFWLPVASLIQSNCYFECDAVRTAPVWWTLIFMVLADFSSVKKKCWFSGGHLIWLPVATMIQSKRYFDCDAFLTAPVWWTVIFINWVLAFHSRWIFWVWKVVFCFLPCNAVKSFFVLIVMHFVPLQYDGP